MIQKTILLFKNTVNSFYCATNFSHKTRLVGFCCCQLLSFTFQCGHKYFEIFISQILFSISIADRDRLFCTEVMIFFISGRFSQDKPEKRVLVFLRGWIHRFCQAMWNRSLDNSDTVSLVLECVFKSLILQEFQLYYWKKTKNTSIYV